MTDRNIENGQKELAKRRKLAGIDARLSTDNTCTGTRRDVLVGSLQAHHVAPIPQDDTQAPRTPQDERKPKQRRKLALMKNGETVRIFPSLATAFLDRENRLHDKPIDSTSRVWLTLRALLANDNGGAVDYDQARDWLTNRASPWRIFGTRQFKAIMARGEGVFWTRAKDSRGRLRIWLHGAARVARALGVERLRGKPADVTVSRITGKIADYRATLYAVWVRGRGEDAKPMSRQVKTVVTNCSKYRQRSYEARAGIKTTRNFCIYKKYSDYNLERARFHEGRAAFRFIDWHGRYGKKGQHYVAWHLPNSDAAPRWCHAVDNKRTKALNKSIADPCIIGGEGNDKDIVRVFFDSVKAAAVIVADDLARQAYWEPTPKTPIKKSDPAGIWSLVGIDA